MMRGKQASLALRAGIALLTAVGGAAMAAPYTFVVPVEIRDIDARYPYAGVGCFLQDANQQPMGYGEVRMDIRPNTRPYASTVTVTVNPAPNTNPQNIARYSCVLVFCASTQGECHRPGLSTEPTLQVEPGAPFRSQVNGPVN